MYTAKDRLKYTKLFNETLSYLKSKKRILFLVTSNRWNKIFNQDNPKSTQLAYKLADTIGKKNVEIIEVPKLKIYPCEGNVSLAKGNDCGVKKSLLQNPFKNPSGCHRCWVNINHPDDELWKISKSLLQSDCVLFFTSIRWGQTNSEYQKLIERLTWLENRHSTLGESNLLQNISAGIIAVGHNWKGDQVVETQKKVLTWFGFKVISKLCWNWQFTTPNDESQESYQAAASEFKETFLNIK